MEIILCKSNKEDIHNLHLLCFSFDNHWYKNAFRDYIDNSLVIEYDNLIIGVLLQDNFIKLIKLLKKLII